MDIKFAAIVGATSLALAGCSSGADTASVPATVTETSVATTTAKSEAERSADLDLQMRKLGSAYDVTEENLRNECIMAIHAELPDAGNYDFPDPIDFGTVDPGKGAHTAGGDFLYEDANDVWTKGAYFCSVFSKEGTITEASAFVI